MQKCWQPTIRNPGVEELTQGKYQENKSEKNEKFH